MPPDTEFPNDAKAPWAVYLRLTGRGAGPTRVLFRVHYSQPAGGWRELSRIPCWTAIPLAADGDETHDVVLNLPYLRLGGVGLHAITVHFWYDGVDLGGDDRTGRDAGADAAGWEIDHEAVFGAPDWAFGAVEYFWIERSS